jgi:thioesterase domain-containing protein
MLAYEMAQQLRVQGEQIDLLALINPSTAEFDAFKSFSPLVNGIGTLLHMNRDAQGDFFLRVRHMIRHMYRNLFPFDRQLRDFPKLVSIDARLKRMFPTTDALHKDYISILSWIVPDYKPGYYSGKITFFWPGEELFLKDIWNKVSQAREVEEFVLPGTHLTVISKHIDTLAEYLRKCLARVQKEEIDHQEMHQQISLESKDVVSEKLRTVL